MARGSARIALIERPIDESIEKHGGSARRNHANENERECSERRQTVRCHDERSERKRQGKNCVRETDQLKKARERIR